MLRGDGVRVWTDVPADGIGERAEKVEGEDRDEDLRMVTSQNTVDLCEGWTMLTLNITIPRPLNSSLELARSS